MTMTSAYTCWLQAQREGQAIEVEMKDVTSESLALPAPTCIVCETSMDGYGECPNCDYNHD